MKTQSQLPYETLQDFIAFIEGLMVKYQNKNWQKYLDFLVSLQDCYILCSVCNRMISLDEIFEIVNEEPVCQECYETT